MFLRPVFFLALLTILCSSVSAQTNIRGRVTNYNGVPIGNATIKLLSKDSASVLLNKTSDAKGWFNLSAPLLDREYLIEISHIAFSTCRERIYINKNLDKERIFLLKGNISLLNEVSIASKVPLITRKYGTVTLHVSDNKLLQGKTFDQLVQLVPGVHIVNGDIAINGIVGVTIMVNEQLLKLNGDQLKNYLSNIQAGEIQNIEVTGNPPVEFPADGIGGIININIRKPRIDGISGYMGVRQIFGLGRYPSTNPSISVSSKKKNLQFNFRYSYYLKKQYYLEEQNRTPANESSFSSISKQSIVSNLHNFSTGFSYDINKMQILTLNYSGNNIHESTNGLSESKTLASRDQDSEYSTGNFDQINSSAYNNVGINYNLITDTLNSRFSINADFTRNNDNRQNGVESYLRNYKSELISDTLYNYVIPSASNIYTTAVKYAKFFKSGWGVNFGARYSSSAIVNNNSVEIFQNDIYILDPLSAFNYKYREQIATGFLEAKGRYRGVDFRIGLRGEHTSLRTELNSESSVNSYNTHYTNFFPSAFIGRDLGSDKDYNVSLSYSRRISRPQYSALNPYMYNIDNNTVFTGNPNLKPSFSNDIQLNIVYRSQYNLSLQYANLRGQILRVNSLDSTNMSTLRFDNIGKTKLYTINLSAPVKISKYWVANNFLSLMYSDILAQGFNIGKGTFVFRNNNDFDLSKTVSCYLNTFYTPRNVYANRIPKGFGSVDAGLSKKMYKDSVMLNIDLTDIFYTQNPTITNYYNGYQFYSRPKCQTRQIFVTLRYNFQSGKGFRKNLYEKSSVEESDRL